MKTIRRVRQRFRSDCGVACVAMVAGVSYQQAFNAFGFSDRRKAFYTGHSHLVEALECLGCEVRRQWFRSWQEVPGFAILPVNHRCNRKNFHWVAYDGKAVCDPNPKRPSKGKCPKRYRASGWYLLVVSRVG